MGKRPSILQIVLIVTTFLLTVTSAFVYFKRSQLPYNTEGRFFDEDQHVVYHEQTLITIVCTTFLMLGILSLVIVWTIKTVKK